MLFITREHPQHVYKAGDGSGGGVSKTDLDIVIVPHCLFFKMKCSHDEALL